ncbi:MAG: hypothetical protein HY020_24270 [Burkholderiales bacterium]|nr:hypothetical protein [Burkholderiales bacterium]
MQTQPRSQTQDTLRQGRANVLRITSRQLSAWVIASRLGVVEPKSDEEAWEGTEIDVRRTVL